MGVLGNMATVSEQYIDHPELVQILTNLWLSSVDEHVLSELARYPMLSSIVNVANASWAIRLVAVAVCKAGTRGAWVNAFMNTDMMNKLLWIHANSLSDKLLEVRFVPFSSPNKT